MELPTRPLVASYDLQDGSGAHSTSPGATRGSNVVETCKKDHNNLEDQTIPTQLSPVACFSTQGHYWAKPSWVSPSLANASVCHDVCLFFSLFVWMFVCLFHHFVSAITQERFGVSPSKLVCELSYVKSRCLLFLSVLGQRSRSKVIKRSKTILVITGSLLLGVETPN